MAIKKKRRKKKTGTIDAVKRTLRKLFKSKPKKKAKKKSRRR